MSKQHRDGNDEVGNGKTEDSTSDSPIGVDRNRRFCIEKENFTLYWRWFHEQFSRNGLARSAEDLASVSAISVWKSGISFESRELLNSYLCGVVDNQVRGEFARYFSSPRTNWNLESVHATQNSDHETELDRSDTVDRLMEAILDRGSPNERLIVTYRLDGLSYGEIELKMNMSSSRLAKIYSRFRKRLSLEFENSDLVNEFLEKVASPNPRKGK